MRRKVEKLLAFMLLAAIVLAVARPGPSLTPAERLALRVDAVLDSIEQPSSFLPELLDPYWTYEVFPFFQYEGLTGEWYLPATVTWEAQTTGVEHNHLLGYTYCEDEVFLNIRMINTESAWYGWERNPLATLVHELIHTLGGDFCSWDSAMAESATQTGTLEVLAALANGGNRVALYSLLLELRDMAMGAALADALAGDDLDGYREFRAQVYPGALDEARFEKSMRFWASDMKYLAEILEKYDVLVLGNVTRGEVTLDLPGIGEFEDVLELDDLGYALAHLEEMTDDAGEAS